MWISCWWQGAGLTALETEILYLSTGQVQHRQRQCELSPHHPVHVPQPWPGGTTSRGERGCSVSKAHSILPPQPRLPTRGGPVALVIFVLWTPPVHGDLDWPPHTSFHTGRVAHQMVTPTLLFFLFVQPLFLVSHSSPIFTFLPHPGCTFGDTGHWCEKPHILLASQSFLPCFSCSSSSHSPLPWRPSSLFGGYGVGGGGCSGSCKYLLWRGGGRRQDLEYWIFLCVFCGCLPST